MDKHLMLQRRRALGMSQVCAAAALGVSPTVYARWERGDRSVPAALRERVAAFLGVDSATLSRAERCTQVPRVAGDARHRVREPYPIGGSIDDVARLGRHACAIISSAKEAIGDEAVCHLADVFPRDTKHELLVVLTLIARGARPIWTRPLRFDCPLLVLDDFRSEYGGDQMQWALLWEGDGELVVVFGQVRVKTIFQSTRARCDFLVYHKVRGRRGQWTPVELDGSQHATQPSQDAERAENLLVPTVRYDNQKLLSDAWFPRFLQDLRAASERGARMRNRRDAESDTYRREREAQLQRRIEEM